MCFRRNMTTGAMCSLKEDTLKQKKMVGIGEASDLLGVHIDTLRQWDKDGKFTPVKTFGNHRRYLVSDVQRLQGTFIEEKQPVGINVAVYCRVSSHEQKQKGDLGRQTERVMEYCHGKGYAVTKAYDEVGSGMCDTRSKLQQLFRLVESGDIQKVIVEHKDRLTRFSFNYLAKYFTSHGVEIEFVEEVLGKSFEQELVADMLTIMSSFSAKLYGRRSAGRKHSRLQDRDSPKQLPSDAASQERGSGEMGIQFRTGSEEESSPEQRTSAECHRATSPPERVEEDDDPVGIRSEQMQLSRSTSQSGQGIRCLLEKPQRSTKRQEGRVPEIQEQEERHRQLSPDRSDPCIQRPHSTTKDRRDPVEGTRLPAD
jgi:putative resolvase